MSIRYLVCVCLLVFCGHCTASQSALYADLDDGVLLRTWLTLGPIPISEGVLVNGDADARRSAFEKDELEECGGVEAIRPQAGLVARVADRMLTWETFTGDADAVDLSQIYGEQPSAIAYAWAEIRVPRQRTVVLGIGAGGSVRAWLNGELIHERWVENGTFLEDDFLILTRLREGSNRLLLKLHGIRGDWRFAFRALPDQMNHIQSVFVSAVASGNLDEVKRLRREHVDIDVDASDQFGFTALEMAMLNGHEDLVAYLVSQGATKAQRPPPEGTSALWGESGERWTSSSLLPYFSLAGYRFGEHEIPNVPVKANVREFGAKGDGKTDDTAAFTAAIQAVEDGAVYIPQGRYVIRDVLYIRKPRVVLRGAGPNTTVLMFPNSLLETLGRDSSTGPDGNWSWHGGHIWVEGHDDGRTLAKVISVARRGDRTLHVSSTDRIEKGDTVRLVMTDNGGYLNRELNGRMCTNVRADSQSVDFPARVMAIGSDTVTLDRALRVETRPEWKPELRAFAPTVHEVGIENLACEHPRVPYPGHWRETGHNSILFSGVTNSWVRNVRIKNADNGATVNRCVNSSGGVLPVLLVALPDSVDVGGSIGDLGE